MHRAIVCLRPGKYLEWVGEWVGGRVGGVVGGAVGSSDGKAGGRVSLVLAPGVDPARAGIAGLVGERGAGGVELVRIRPGRGLAGVRAFACPAQRRAMAVYEALRELDAASPIGEIVVLDEAGEGFFLACARASGVAFADAAIRCERVVVEEDRHAGDARTPWTLRDLVVDAMQRHASAGPAGPAGSAGSAGAAWGERDPGAHDAEEVSVVIPHFNDGAHLEEAVASLEAQTLRPHAIVLVEDGSTDADSLRVVGALERAGRVRVVRQENRGLAAARNTGWRACATELVAFLDADDVVMPGWLASCARAIGRTRAAAAAPIVATFDADPGTITGGWCPVAFDAALLGVMNAGVPGSGAVLRRAALEGVGGFDESMPAYEDWALSAALAARGESLAVVPEALFRYRQRSGSLIRRTGRPNHDRWRAIISARHGGADDGRVAQALLDEMTRLRARVRRQR